ncbi:MAG: nuclear transport factor 2 family protein [Candidatus Promineifilaceae bacterium]
MRNALQFYEAFNGHDVARMMQWLNEDCHLETSGPAPDGLVYTGKEALARYWEEFFRESPQAQIEVEDIFGLGMRVVARRRMTWVDAQGEERSVRGVDILRIKDGLISEILAYKKG